MKPFVGDLPSLHFVIGSMQTLAAMPKQPAMEPFCEPVLTLLSALSQHLLLIGKGYSDVAAFAFWCRRSALQKAKDNYADAVVRLGRGVVFHSTPSNVPVNFAFSFAAGLLAGNANIVRLPAKQFTQVDIICETIEKLLTKSEHAALSPYVAMLRYKSSTDINNYFSSLCDTRVIWGGDETIARMRISPLQPRATELTFSDRYSLAVIDADGYLALQDKKRIAQDFYNDTYLFDQNACTAPRMVVWLGNKKAEAKALFWSLLLEQARERYTFAPVQSMSKLHAAYLLAAQHDVCILPEQERVLVRVAVNGPLDAELLRYKSHSGFFLEYDAAVLDEMLPLCASPCQTLVYCGLDPAELRNFLLRSRPRGIDRVVPVGHSLNFSLTWDGYDLIRSLSRELTVV